MLNEPTGQTLNSYGCYSDWREIVNHVKSIFPRAEMYMVGVSMGAINIQRYLIDAGIDCKVKAAVAISSPWNAWSISEKVRESKILMKLLLRT